MNINFDPEIFNEAFIPLLEDQSRHLALKGGAGSGKSYSVVQKHIYRMLKENNHRFLFVRKVGATIRNSMFNLFKDVVSNYNLNEYFHYRETDMVIRCPLTDSEIICVGMDDREKLKSIAEITSIWVEEVTELTERDFRQLNMRLRGRRENYKQSIYTFNPIDEDHWVHAELFPPAIDQALEKKKIARWVKRVPVEENGKKVLVPIHYTCSHSTYEDNRFLDYEEKADLEDLKNKDYNYWLVYAKGKWGRVGNLVFDPPWKIGDRSEFYGFDEVVYGMDFGYHHPTTCVKVGYKNEKIYVQEKLYVKKMTKPEIIEMMLKDKTIEDMTDAIYGDSAEPDTIQDFNEAGFDMRASLKGNNSVKDSIDYLKSLEIIVHPDSVNLQRELRSFRWALDKEGKPIEGKVVPYNDDLIAAIRYAVYTHSRGQEVQLGFVRRSA